MLWTVGSYQTAKQMSRILDILIKIPYSSDLQTPLLSVATAALTSTHSDLSVWMSSGRRFIDHVWSASQSLAVPLTGALCELNWGGFKQFALPAFTSRCLDILGSTHEDLKLRTLRTIVLLVKNGMLKGAEDDWRTKLGAWVRHELEKQTTLSIPEDFVREYCLLAHSRL